MDIQLHIPSLSKLSEYVTGIWEVCGNRNIKEVILPQGVVEMVFNFSDSLTGVLPHSSVTFAAPQCFIQGFNTNIVQATYSGQQHLFGIRLQPGMVKGLLGVVPSELKNNLVDLTLIKPGFKFLWQQLREAGSFVEKINIIVKEFPVLSDEVCFRTRRLCDMFNTGGIENFSSLDSLSKQVYFCTRHLNRKSRNLFGISAEELITYKRYLHAVNLIHSKNNPLTSIAYDSGFFDQAHFCRVFKSYTGITAKQYRQNKGPLPFHLFSES